MYGSGSNIKILDFKNITCLSEESNPDAQHTHNVSQVLSYNFFPLVEPWLHDLKESAFFQYMYENGESPRYFTTNTSIPNLFSISTPVDAVYGSSSPTSPGIESTTTNYNQPLTFFETVPQVSQASSYSESSLGSSPPSNSFIVGNSQYLDSSMQTPSYSSVSSPNNLPISTPVDAVYGSSSPTSPGIESTTTNYNQPLTFFGTVPQVSQASSYSESSLGSSPPSNSFIVGNSQYLDSSMQTPSYSSVSSPNNLPLSNQFLEPYSPNLDSMIQTPTSLVPSSPLEPSSPAQPLYIFDSGSNKRKTEKSEQSTKSKKARREMDQIVSEESNDPFSIKIRDFPTVLIQSGQGNFKLQVTGRSKPENLAVMAKSANFIANGFIGNVNPDGTCDMKITFSRRDNNSDTEIKLEFYLLDLSYKKSVSSLCVAKCPPILFYFNTKDLKHPTPILFEPVANQAVFKKPTPQGHIGIKTVADRLKFGKTFPMNIIIVDKKQNIVFIVEQSDIIKKDKTIMYFTMPEIYYNSRHDIHIRFIKTSEAKTKCTGIPKQEVGTLFKF